MKGKLISVFINQVSFLREGLRAKPAFGIQKKT
jgi:hypothetical protein